MSRALPEILDPCCGSRMMYFDKENPLVLFCDNRELHTRLCDGRRLDVKPEVKCDFRELPFPDETFRHVAFDPPHLLSGGDSSWIIKKYGRLPRDRWKEYLRRGFQECWRVLADQGTLVFKWSEEDIPLKEVLPLFPDEPVYGNLARNNRQIFLVLFKGNHDNSEVGHPAWDDGADKNAQRPLVICAPDIREGAGSKEDLLIHKQALWKTVSPGGTLVLQWNHPVSPKETERLFPDAVYGNRNRGDRQTFLVFYKPLT